MANGIRKNWKVVREEIQDWRALIGIHVRTFKDAEGIADKAHKAVNILTESVRLLPRTVTYLVLIAMVLDIALHIWLWIH